MIFLGLVGQGRGVFCGATLCVFMLVILSILVLPMISSKCLTRIELHVFDLIGSSCHLLCCDWLHVITLCCTSFKNRFTTSKMDRLVNNCCVANVPWTRFKKKQVDYFFSFPGNRLECTPRERGRLFRN